MTNKNGNPDRLEAALERLADQISMLAVLTVESTQKQDQAHEKFRANLTEMSNKHDRAHEKLMAELAEIKDITNKQTENVSILVKIVDKLLPPS
jgi:NADPH-dependent ferric siderophore reductase